MKRLILGIFFLLFMSWAINAEPVNEAPLLVLAGVASRPALEEAAALFTERHHVYVSFLYGGSGDMLSKISMTGVGDIFIPASHDYMEMAVSRDLVSSDSCRLLAYLVPALLVTAENPAGIKELADLASPGVKIAFARPENVALGLYAAEIIDRSGLREPVQKNITVFLENAAKVANAVALGSVDAAIGWREMKSWESGRLKVIPLAPSLIYRVASIKAGIVKSCRRQEIAEKFIEFLVSDTGRKIFARHGYLTSEKEIKEMAPNCEIGGTYQLPEHWK